MLLMVAPFVGAWIEIRFLRLESVRIAGSLPSWERGLKLYAYKFVISSIIVAPFVGAWIEIFIFLINLYVAFVAPFVGAWIEI